MEKKQILLSQIDLIYNKALSKKKDLTQLNAEKLLQLTKKRNEIKSKIKNCSQAGSPGCDFKCVTIFRGIAMN